MLLMNTVETSAYRYLGCAGSCFTLFQSCIWLLLSLIGAMCKYSTSNCGASVSDRTFRHCFYLMYYYEPQNITFNGTRPNYINPTIFNSLMWINVLLNIGNIAISLLTARAFIQWKDAMRVRKTAYIWTRYILAVSVCELIMFIIFASDIVALKQKEDMRCFLRTNLSVLQSSYRGVRTPAPYLLQLKSNLKMIRKKIRKYNKKLLILDAVIDEKSPDHLKNPFISKSVVNSYVEDIWQSMFNNSIREKVRRKADAIPVDEVMRNFVISEHLDLDDIDYDLLKNFDGLTHKKWIKPIKSSTRVVGRPFNLSSSITATNDSAELDKLSSLLVEYLKNTDILQPPITTNTSQYDQNLDDLFKAILDEFEEQETHIVHNKDSAKKLLAKVDLLLNQNDTIIPNDNEEVLLGLKKFFDYIITEDEGQEKLKDQNVKTVINKIKEFVENNQTVEITDDDIFNMVKESLNQQLENDPLIKSRNLPARRDEYSDYYYTNEYYSDEYYSDDTEPPPPPPPPPVSRSGYLFGPTGYWDKAGKFNFYLHGSKSGKTFDKDGNEIMWPPPSKQTLKSYASQELCRHCAYFILAPSIVCMILSLKTGLVWVLNIAAAVLLLYYGNKITLKKKCKFLPCLSQKT